MRRFTRKSLTVLVLTPLLLVGGGVAFAYWTNSGTGTGTATTGTNSAITVVQTGSSATLYPGMGASTLSGTFNNPNTSTVYVNDVTATLTSVTGGGSAPDPCTIADYSLTVPTISIDAQVLANDTSVWSGIQVVLLNTGLNQDKCKNATINVSYASN